MAKFKNIVTGNILEVTDPLTVALMTASDRYEAEDAADDVAEAPVAKKSTKAKAAAEA